jgi:hypothetical protein
MPRAAQPKEISMSIGGIGTSGATNPLLTSLLSRIDASSSSTPQITDPDDSDFMPDTGSATSNALTGSTTAQLSSNVMDVLLGLQQQSGAPDPNASASGAQIHHGGGGHRHHGVSGSSSGGDTLEQIMDADADGNTSTDAPDDLMTQGSDSANPADFMAAIQKYQSQNAGTTQTTV